MTNEEKIKSIIKEVASVSPNYEYPPCSNDYIECPFCFETVESWRNKNVNMKDIKHSNDCVYLIANEILKENK